MIILLTFGFLSCLNDIDFISHIRDVKLEENKFFPNVYKIACQSSRAFITREYVIECP